MENQIASDCLRKCCILLFAKYPKAGAVKTRLAEKIGDQKAAQLYTQMAMDTIDHIRQTNFPFEILYWPNEYGLQMPAMFGVENIYVPQEGKDLSERLINGFNRAFKNGFEYAIAVGSDSPDMPQETVTEAFMNLKSSDAVLGPTSDGGYYLIGFSKTAFVREVFDNISWSTPQVLSQTLVALKNQNKTVALTPEWQDIDTFDDLLNFARRNRSDFGTASRTLSYISKEIPYV